MRSSSRIRTAVAAVVGVAVLAAVTPGGAQAAYFQAPQSAGVCEGADNLHAIGDFGLRAAQVAWGNTIGPPSPEAPQNTGFAYDAGVLVCKVFRTAADGGSKVFDYRATGGCLAILGTTGPRQFTPTAQPPVTNVAYCATEDAPTEAQITAAEGGPTSTPAHPSEAQLLTIPVAQVAVAVDVRLPDGCQVTDSSKRRISRDAAAAAFEGAITTWGDIFGAGIGASPGSGLTDTDCRAKSFRRVVRKDSSGTTSLLKRYLQAVSELPGGSSVDWREPSFGGTLANDAWPNDSGASAVLRGDASGADSQLDKLSAQALDGAIGYADLSTSRTKSYGWESSGIDYEANDRTLWLRVQRIPNDAYNSPGISNDQGGNKQGAACVDVEYSNQPTTNLGQSWAATTAVRTPTDYPICGLHYVVTSLWGFDTEANRFRKVWAGSTAGEFRAARDYLRYVVGIIATDVGPSRLRPADYAKLPEDVQATAQCATKRIGWLRASSDPQPASPIPRDPTGADPDCLPRLTRVDAWGFNVSGQLGNGTDGWDADSSTPVTVSRLPTASAVAAGDEHSLALLAGGTVRAWGRNDRGQLGNGTTTQSSTPVSVRGISTASAVAAGGGGSEHSLALLSDGTVKAWGWNLFGQLGDGGTARGLTPVTVSGISTATAVTGGGSHSLALLSGGTVKAWGSNFNGQLGNGSTTTTSSTPVMVSGISTATAVAGGASHSLALLSGGTVRAWGANYVGQLGDGTSTDSSTPVSVSGLTNATAVDGGSLHSLALLSDGTVKAWGNNASGQLGDGTTTTSSTPVTVEGLTDVAAIVAGGHHSLALKADGMLWAWGHNGNGQLGNGTTANSPTPLRVGALQGVGQIAAGGFHNLALTPLRPGGV